MLFVPNISFVPTILFVPNISFVPNILFVPNIFAEKAFLVQLQSAVVVPPHCSATTFSI